MRGELLFDEPGATTRSVSSPPTLSLLAAALTTLTCGALCAVAIVAHAPEVVVPLVVAICIVGTGAQLSQFTREFHNCRDCEADCENGWVCV